MMRRFIQIKTSISADGLGSPSVSVYFSYCDKKVKCPMCHNKELQKDGVGYNLHISEAIKLIKKEYDFIKNIFGHCKLVFVGGEPLANINIEYARLIAQSFHNTESIIYTWREKTDLKSLDLSGFDIFVCGEYIDRLSDDNYILGSTNQYILNNKLENITNSFK